jgi:uncharacterized protein (TIGR00251 family)
MADIAEPKDKILKILVRPNSRKSEVIGLDEARNCLRVNIAAPPDKGKANKEAIRFFSKLFKKKVRIISGLKSKEKLIKIE